MDSYAKSSGQALIEYVLVMAFVLFLATRLVGNFTDFMRDSAGNLGHVLSVNLTVGVCPQQGFFDTYKNGFQP